MNINVSTEIVEKLKEINVCIKAPEITPKVEMIQEKINMIASNKMDRIVGLSGNEIYIIKIEEIIFFYSEEKECFCKTENGVYRVKERLYFLEDNLDKEKFIRISNSVIANVNKIKCFNVDIVGKILVKFTDGSKEDVSRRRTKSVMEFLKRR